MALPSHQLSLPPLTQLSAHACMLALATTTQGAHAYMQSGHAYMHAVTPTQPAMCAQPDTHMAVRDTHMAVRDTHMVARDTRMAVRDTHMAARVVCRRSPAWLPVLCAVGHPHGCPCCLL